MRPVTQNEQFINCSGVLQKNKFAAKPDETEENKYLLKIDCPLVVKLFKHALTKTVHSFYHTMALFGLHRDLDVVRCCEYSPAAVIVKEKEKHWR